MPPSRPRSSSGDRLRVERRESEGAVAWEIVQPRCARKRRDDIEEVEAMVEAGETERIFTKPKLKQTEDYVTGRFG